MREPQGSGAAIEERAPSQKAGGAQSRRQKGSQAGARSSKATQTTIIMGNHAAAKLDSSQHAAGRSGAPWRFRRGWAGALPPRSWREQDPGGRGSQRTAESRGGGVERQRDPGGESSRHPAGAWHGAGA